MASSNEPEEGVKPLSALLSLLALVNLAIFFVAGNGFALVLSLLLAVGASVAHEHVPAEA